MATQLTQKNVVDVGRLISFTCSDRPASEPLSKPAQLQLIHNKPSVYAKSPLNPCIIIIIITFSFMQGIYTHIPETNNVSKEYNVAAILSLLFMVPISLVPLLTLMYFYISTFRSIIIIIIIIIIILTLQSLLKLSLFQNCPPLYFQ
jgi:hypothetical protein